MTTFSATTTTTTTVTAAPPAPTFGASTGNADEGLGTGAIVGIVIGVAVVAIIAAILVVVVLKYMKKNKVVHNDKEKDNEDLEFDNDKALGKNDSEGP